MEDFAKLRSEWSLQETVGTLSYGAIAGEVDLARPQLGLRLMSFDGAGSTCSLIGNSAYCGAAHADRFRGRT